MDAAQRIADLEHQLAEKDQIIAAQQARIVQLEQRVSELTKLVES